MNRDAPAWALTAATRLLPATRRDWGAAMSAELAGVEGRPDRRRFAAGCVAAIVTRPAVLLRAGYLLAPVAVVAYVVRWSATIGEPPRRWGVVALVAVLALVMELGVVGPLGPVGGGRAARLVRVTGYALVGVLAVEAVLFLAGRTGPDLAGVPVFGVMFAGYLAAGQALTAHRSTATPRALLTGAAAGTAAAAAWTAAALLAPPIPPGPWLAILLIAAGMAAAGRIGGRAAALGAGTTAALLILNLVTAASVLAPAWLIPHLAPPALAPATQLAESRIELPDPYLWLLLLGWFVALAQWVAATPRRAR
ncbi:hypothetical protein KZZ52_22915 [Dactylosporangium sp. AC04546]|uniref:hypothetical protein n=1 Tax=Dactylosporangium sp. AC04546 TaxID=2862460 RepID=UPI001EDCC95D|nr:hypothetical protein [Dactylosporangium sp. AC04546]WVK88131.1 hypothetical protein KZZ52_22915 [Dactylosporangium sp. AC04546]